MSYLAKRIEASGLDKSHVLALGPSGPLTLSDVIRDQYLLNSQRSSDALRDRQLNIAISINSPFEFVRAIFALDGRAPKILLLAPTLPKTTISILMERVGAKLLISDRSDVEGACELVASIDQLRLSEIPLGFELVSEWLMTTSGTTGTPKVVRHTLQSLAGNIRTARWGNGTPLWGLLYDPSRFAGMQVVLQALLGQGTLIAPDSDWSWDERLAFLRKSGCSHLSTTPTLWRKILMSSEQLGPSLRQITLGGEIVDQPLLNALIRHFPKARVTHIYASTEAGVGFSVKDGGAGFPIQLLREASDEVSLKVINDVLWLRPAQFRSVQPDAPHIERDRDGYINTGDRVQIMGDRVHFVGRESGTINIGGIKIRAEEIENIVRGHPGIADCVVLAKPSPIVGTILALTIVPKQHNVDQRLFLSDIKKWCKENLQREAQPASIKIEKEIAANAAGKTPRNGPE
jgi:acyl-CoA synthetase (AMP-forming)/AMP-acid ligase II